MQVLSEQEICQSALEVYHAGELTVLGFGGREILHDFNLAEYRDEITELVHENGCKALAFDLTAVRSIPSGLPGILKCLVREGLEIHVYNASADIREMLELAKLHRALHFHDIEV